LARCTVTHEPLEKTEGLWKNPYVTVLPHISAPTNKHTASQVVAKNIRTYFDSNKIPNQFLGKMGIKFGFYKFKKRK